MYSPWFYVCHGPDITFSSTSPGLLLPAAHAPYIVQSPHIIITCCYSFPCRSGFQTLAIIQPFHEIPPTYGASWKNTRSEMGWTQRIWRAVIGKDPYDLIEDVNTGPNCYAEKPEHIPNLIVTGYMLHVWVKTQCLSNSSSLKSTTRVSLFREIL